MEIVEGAVHDNGAKPMFYDADLDNFEHEDEPLKVSPYMLKSFQFVKDKATGYYGCQFCSYRSMHRSSIKSHLAVHSSARPFACGMCEYEAKRVNDLRKHWLIKHGKRLATRSRGYRSRVSPNSNMATQSGSNNQTMRTDVADNLGVAESQKDDTHLPFSLSGDPSKWTADSGQLSNMPVYPEPEMCLESASPRSDFNEPDMDLIDAEDDDINHLDIFQHSGNEELVVVKPEPPQDEFYGQTDKETDGKDDNIRPDVAKRCKRRKTSEDSKSDLSVDQKASENISKDNQPLKVKPTDSQSVSSTLHHSKREVADVNSSQSSGIASLRNSQSPSTSLLQTKNLSGASMMAQGYGNDSKVNRRHNHSESIGVTVSDIKNCSRNQMQYSWTSDSSNSTTVTSSAFNLRHANVGTNRGWMCSFCNIQFFDNAIYFMHMGLHDRRDPWKCTVCGKRLYDVYSFTSHFVNGHSSG